MLERTNDAIDLRLGVLRRPRTEALLSGRVAVDGYNVEWVSELSHDKRHRLILEGELDGGEMSTAGFVRARVAGHPFRAVPVFIKRGFPHRHIVVAAEGPVRTAADLPGKRVGLPTFGASIMVWLRGVLADQFGIGMADVHWVQSGREDERRSAPPGVEIEGAPVPDDFDERSVGDVSAIEPLDGVQSPIARAELHLYALLFEGKLDAVVSTHAVESPRLSCLISGQGQEEAYFQRTGVYPVFHTVVLQDRVVERFPSLPEALVEALGRARDCATDYLGERARNNIEVERQRLNGRDPFVYRLEPVEERALTTFARYLRQQGLIERTPPLDELLVGGTAAWR